MASCKLIHVDMYQLTTDPPDSEFTQQITGRADPFLKYITAFGLQKHNSAKTEC